MPNIKYNRTPRTNSKSTIKSSKSSYGYDFYFKVDNKNVLTFPITPSALNIRSDSNNKVVNLINEGDINILKSPSLTEIEFDARFPMRQYPYARTYSEFKSYFDVFKELKESKESFRFIVTRTTPGGTHTWDTNLLVSLESFEINETAEEGDDVIITFKLKQFKEYGVVKVKKKTTTTKKTTTNKKTTTVKKKTTPQRSTKKVTNKTYTVKKGDCLWNIAKKFYGKGSEWKKIYNANKNVIEKAAKKHGKKSSSNGHWIYPGTKLTIPAKK
jgi:LysM repeat protein